VWIHVRRHGNAKPRCVICNRILAGTIRTVEAQWRHLDMMGIPTFLVGEVREGHCPVHGRRHERIPWAAPRARFTREFDRQVAVLAQVASKDAVRRMYGIAWRTVGRIIERVVDLHLPKDRFQGVRAIGVDETSYKRGHRYLTVVSCLGTGRVLWVAEGKSAETLGAFFEAFGRRRSRQLELIAMDMSAAFRKAVEHHAPQADVVFDRFHVVKLLLDAIDEIRREEVRRTHGEAAKALKGTRYSLLRNPRHLRPADVDKIEQVQKSNGRLSRAWERRVELEQFWEIEDEFEARQYLLRWTRSALLSRIEPLRKFARTIREHMKGILGFVRHRGQTNAALEGMNNKIKMIIHRAYGFRSVPALISMIHLCCSGIDLS
jgi:transposase